LKRLKTFAFDAVDGSSTGTQVPWMWVLLMLPRFGGAEAFENAQRYTVPQVQPNRVPDHIWREAVAGVGDCLHARE
jgi:hypothetical protein